MSNRHSSIVNLQSQSPPWDGITVISVSIPERLDEFGFFVGNHKDMKAQKNQEGVNKQQWGGEKKRFSKKDRTDAKVHGIPHVPIQTPYHELFWRIHRSRCASTCNRKIPHSPKVKERTQEDQNPPGVAKETDLKGERRAEKRQDQVGRQHGRAAWC